VKSHDDSDAVFTVNRTQEWLGTQTKNEPQA